MNKPSKKMELPTMTVKKKEAWKEAEDLYTEGYNGLTTVIKGVGVIVNNHKNLPPEVDINKVTKMVVAIQKDSDQLRNELTEIHKDMTEAQKTTTHLADVNMYGIVHASRMEEWNNKYYDVLLTQFNDLTEYVEQSPGEVANEPTTDQSK